MPFPYPTAVERFPTVRQSLLSKFDECALSAKFYIDLEGGDGHGNWNSHPQARGIIFHRFASKALLAMEEAGENTIPRDVALEILRECLRQHDVDARDQINIPFSQIKDLRWVVMKFAKDNAFQISQLASVEERLEAIVEYEGPDGVMVPRMMTGQLDALFMSTPEHAVVLDWKDTWALPAPKDLSEKGYFQQRFYGFLVLERYRAIQEVTLREHYVRHDPGDGVGSGNTREATITREHLADIREEIAALVERFDRAVEHGNYPPERILDEKGNDTGQNEEVVLWVPAPGKHCGWCPRPSACPIFPDARVQGAIETPEQAERYAAEALVAKAALDQRQKAMKAWADVRGPIPIKHAKDPNRVWGHRKAKRKARPTKAELENALMVEGANVDVDRLYVEHTQAKFEQHTRDPAETEETPDDAGLMNALDESVKRIEKPDDSAPPPPDKTPPSQDDDQGHMFGDDAPW